MSDSLPTKRPVGLARMSFTESTGKMLLPIDVLRFIFAPGIPWPGRFWALFTLVFGALYAIFPFDIIPDPVPYIGLVDDVALLYGPAIGFVHWARQFTSWRTISEIMQGQPKSD